MSQDRKRHQERVTKFSLEKWEGYRKETFLLCGSRLSSSTLLHCWLVSRAGRPLHIAEFAQTIPGMAVSSQMDSGNPAETDPPSVIIFETTKSESRPVPSLDGPVGVTRTNGSLGSRKHFVNFGANTCHVIRLLHNQFRSFSWVRHTHTSSLHPRKSLEPLAPLFCCNPGLHSKYISTFVKAGSGNKRRGGRVACHE
ncbi:hypothetical protein ARMGADRAFT_539295 [Armillaria gallica]|uniref:Uncharacterized protein n=1 Tax=Armillaria gallica TaxID=47427 RepID=A0A2H3CT91_ARMGA|nr:hypothetical protein ARMGADRAFT_539295 [Armillaria gallica]